MRSRVCIALASIVVAATSLAAKGGPVSTLPTATQRAIRAEVLDKAKVDNVIDTVKDVTAEVLKRPDWKKVLLTRAAMPFDKQVAALKADPAAARILAAHALSARRYMLRLLALRAASAAAAGADQGLATLANPANVALLKADPSLQRRLAEAEMGGTKPPPPGAGSS
jgi:hypothetical protein